MKNIFLILLVLSFVFTLNEVNGINDEELTRINRAASYLLEHYDSELGLIFESEDRGTHWLKRVDYPEYRWRYYQTYWLYSDNLVASYALEPWAPEVSTRIKETIESHQVPKSNKFEALIGEPIGPDRDARNIIVAQHQEYVILIRLHDGLIADPRYKFADSMIYEALTKFYEGDIRKAQEIVMDVYGMWNGTCLVDYGVTQKELQPGNAPSDIGFGMNFKLALLLYGAKVTGTDLPTYNELEEILWSKQQKNGGITTLSTPQGEPTGSANTETTAMTLLIYNEKLISRLQGIANDTMIRTSSTTETILNSSALTVLSGMNQYDKALNESTSVSLMTIMVSLIVLIFVFRKFVR